MIFPDFVFSRKYRKNQQLNIQISDESKNASIKNELKKKTN